MRPHSQYLYGHVVRKDPVYQAMLDIDPARICASEVADQLFKRRWRLEGIDGQNFEKFLSFRF